ncbi:MAG: SLC13 family permease [Anaerolineae bacterium]|nr:SLC13 family permease [Anaerolineae bacterium]
MDFDAVIVVGILVAAMVLFITEGLRADVVALGVVVALLLADILTPVEAFAGFSDSTVVTIAALFVVGGAVFQTGLANQLGMQLLRVAGRDETRLTIVIMIAVAAMSSVISNTGTVAVLLPAVTSLALAAQLSPAKLLMPMAFASSLGGVMTLIGTPPNIVAAEKLAQAGYPSFGFFSYTPIGLIIVVAGTVYMVLVGKHWLPQPVESAVTGAQRIHSAEELLDVYRISGNLFRLRVRVRSRVVGKSFSELLLRTDYNVSVLEILRRAQGTGLGRGRHNERLNSFMPQAETLLQAEDILLVQGSGNDVAHVAAAFNFGIQPADAEDEHTLINQEVGVAEVVLPPNSDVLGKTLQELRFGTLYRLTVLSINRPGEGNLPHLSTTPLRFGDVLLVQGRWVDILALRQNPNDYVVTGQPESMLGAPHREKAGLTLLLLAGLIVLIVADVLPIATVSALGALLVVLTGCITPDEAYEAMDWKSVVLIAGMIPMSTAMQKTGLVDELAMALTRLDQYGPIVVLLGFFLVTSFLTQVISNTATAILLAPVAIAAATEIEANPQPFMMAIAVSASMAFATPVATPANTLVMGAGQYHFRDYMIVGLPLILVALLISMLFIPIFYPF